MKKILKKYKILLISILIICGIVTFVLLSQKKIVNIGKPNLTAAKSSLKEFISYETNIGDVNSSRNIEYILKGNEYNQSNRETACYTALSNVTGTKINCNNLTDIWKTKEFRENYITQELLSVDITNEKLTKDNIAVLTANVKIRQYQSRISGKIGDGIESFIKDEYVVRYRDVTLKNIEFNLIKSNVKEKVGDKVSTKEKWLVQSSSNMEENAGQFFATWQGKNYINTTSKLIQKEVIVPNE